jgi:L-asparaginase
MTTRRVSVATLGGTITMTSPSPGAGAVPTQSAQELLAATPALAGLADLTVETLSTKPGASLRFGELLGVLDWGEQRVRQGADGIVVVQGTDTIEESAYLLDLLWPHEEPLVLTGAMRTPDQASPDGSANLTAAIVAASDKACRGLGAVVVINDEIHAARRVRKQDSIGLGAFSSGVFGPLGRLHENRVTIANHIQRAPILRSPAHLDVAVTLLEATLGDQGDVIRMLARSSTVDGLVIAGLGAGHVSDSAAEAVTAAAAVMPVVLCSRTGGGPVLEATYGFPGSESDLIERKAIPAGWLDARKSRILLSLLLATGHRGDEIRKVFAVHGAAP